MLSYAEEMKSLVFLFLAAVSVRAFTVTKLGFLEGEPFPDGSNITLEVEVVDEPSTILLANLQYISSVSVTGSISIPASTAGPVGNPRVYTVPHTLPPASAVAPNGYTLQLNLFNLIYPNESVRLLPPLLHTHTHNTGGLEPDGNPG